MLGLNIPKVGTPFLGADNEINREWRQFFATLLQVLGGPLVSNNVSAIVPIDISLTSNITGVLTVTSGGTGISSTAVSALLYAPAANTVSSLTVGANSILTSNGAGVPAWSNSLTTLTATNVNATTVSALTVSAGTVDFSNLSGTSVSSATVLTNTVSALNVSATGVSATTVVGNTISAVTVSATTVTAGTVSTLSLIVNGVALPTPGTFTPTIQGDAVAGAGTYTTQQGNYTRVGDRCFFNLRVQWTATTGVGNIQIAGLPFTSNAAASTHSSLAVYTNLGIALATSYVGLIAPNSAFISLYNTAAGVGDGLTPIQAAGDIIIAGSYLL